MAKKVTGYIKLQVPAGKANPSPPIGPALGQRGLNIMEFCKAFNAATQGMEVGLPTPVVITAYSDKSFTFVLKTPPASVLLKKAVGIKSGSAKPNSNKVGKVTRAQLEEIAKTKTPDLTAADMEAAVRTAYHVSSGQEPPAALLNWSAVRGLAGVKEASLALPTMYCCAVSSRSWAMKGEGSSASNRFFKLWRRTSMMWESSGMSSPK